MAIELDASRVAAQATVSQAEDSAVRAATPAKKLTALLGGASLTVTDGSVTDLETLVARLKNEQDKTKFSVLLSSLSAIGKSLTDAQKAVLEEGVELSGKIEELQKTVEKLAADKDAATADAEVLKMKIDALQTQIDIAVQQGKDHKELVLKQKELRKELEDKKRIVAETGEKISEAKNQISSANVRLDALAKSLGDNALKTIAKEFAAVFKADDRETNAEAERKDLKAEATDVFRNIREALDKFEGVLRETIEDKRTQLV